MLDSRFEKNSVDIIAEAPEHGCSIRRCVSFHSGGYGAFDQNSEYERFKHPGRTANFSFADGHVENRPYSKFGANYNLNKEKWLADPSL